MNTRTRTVGRVVGRVPAAMSATLASVSFSLNVAAAFWVRSEPRPSRRLISTGIAVMYWYDANVAPGIVNVGDARKSEPSGLRYPPHLFTRCRSYPVLHCDRTGPFGSVSAMFLSVVNGESSGNVAAGEPPVPPEAVTRMMRRRTYPDAGTSK